MRLNELPLNEICRLINHVAGTGTLAREAIASDHLREGGHGLYRVTPLTRWFPRALVAIALVLQIAAAGIAIADGDVFIIALIPGSAAAAVMGGIIAARRPGHRMGVLLCVSGVADGACVAVFAYARAAVVHFPRELPFGRQAMWMTTWDYVPAVALGALIFPLVFPDGRLLSRRWRPALWGAMAYVPLAVAGNAFDVQSMGGWYHNLSNPYPIHGPLFGTVLDLANVCDRGAPYTAMARLGR